VAVSGARQATTLPFTSSPAIDLRNAPKVLGATAESLALVLVDEDERDF